MEATVQDLKNEVLALIKQKRSEPECNEGTLESDFIWMIAMFRVEEDLDSLSSKDFAKLYISGMPPLTYDVALTYYDDLWDSLETENEEDQLIVWSMAVKRVEYFWWPERNQD